MSRYWRGRLGQWISLLLMGSLAAGSWLLASLLSHQGPASAPKDSSDLTSVVLEAFITRTGAEGNPQQQIRSVRIDQYRDGRSALSEPELIQSKPNHASVKATGRSAEVSADQKVIYLEGEVVLNRSEFGGTPAVSVQTERLEYRVEEEIARTSDPVRVRRGRSELHGVGMVANQKTGRLEVLADSRMVIPREEPAHRGSGPKP